jgi:hypothetical protein
LVDRLAGWRLRDGPALQFHLQNLDGSDPAGLGEARLLNRQVEISDEDRATLVALDASVVGWLEHLTAAAQGSSLTT